MRHMFICVSHELLAKECYLHQQPSLHTVHHSDGLTHRQQTAVHHLLSSCHTVAYLYVHSMLQHHAHCCFQKQQQQKCPCLQSVTQTLLLLQRSSKSVSVQFEFSYFFETGTRRRCYLAPERFIESGQAAPQPDALQPAMASICINQL